jgi:hypothetical protein
MFIVLAGVMIMDFIFELIYSGSYDFSQLFYLSIGGYYIFSSFMSGSFGSNSGKSKFRGVGLNKNQRNIIVNYYKK